MLVDRVNALRSVGKTIVYTNGCFDLLHVGHIRYLQAASREGDILLVALNSDQSARMIKGTGRPVIPLAERAEIVAALECVDLVTWFDGKDCADLIELVKPDIHAKGTDWTDDAIPEPEREIVQSYGGRIAIVGDPKDHSSTAMFERISRTERK